jgi:hypothetical protein
MHEASGVSPSEIWRSVLDAYLTPAREQVGAEAAGAAEASGLKLGYEDAIDYAIVSLAAEPPG